MATVVVNHTPSGGPADPTALVDGPTYDADPHIVTGLENVDNTSDADKPVSDATQAAIDLKKDIDATIDYGAVSDVEAATISSSIDYIGVAGYSAAGDGGRAHYKRVVAEPSHAGKIQSADGAWWELDEVDPNELMFGAVSGATVTAQTEGIQAMLDYCAANSGRKARIVRAHSINDTINVPVEVILEWEVGSTVTIGRAIIDKAFNGDMFTMGNGSVLIRPNLRGNGGTYTGRGIVVDDGNDQIIYDPFIYSMAGPCIEFPTGGEGIRFKCHNGLFNRFTASDYAIVGPATESTGTGFRYFLNPHGLGQPVFQFNNGNLWHIEGGSARCDFSATTTGRVHMHGVRVPGNLDVFGTEHHIHGCTIGGVFTIGAGATYCDLSGNIIASDGYIIDNSGNTTNRIGATLGGTEALTNKTYNGMTVTATTGTLTLASGKVLTFSNTLTFTGTDSSSVAFGAGGTVAYTANKLSAFAATTSLELKGVISDETGSGALVFGTSPNITTPTGIVKSDVGLGNVDNTSDATKNAASATLSSKIISGLATSSPVTTAINYTMLSTDTSIIFNAGSGAVLTLLSAASNPGRWAIVKTIAAQVVISATSNVVPLAGGAAGTAILAATAGKWAMLQSDGTNWIIMMAN
jgi:hypothetical protein